MIGKDAFMMFATLGPVVQQNEGMSNLQQHCNGRCSTCNPVFRRHWKWHMPTDCIYKVILSFLNSWCAGHDVNL